MIRKRKNGVENCNTRRKWKRKTEVKVKDKLNQGIYDNIFGMISCEHYGFL